MHEVVKWAVDTLRTTQLPQAFDDYFETDIDGNITGYCAIGALTRELQRVKLRDLPEELHWLRDRNRDFTLEAVRLEDVLDDKSNQQVAGMIMSLNDRYHMPFNEIADKIEQKILDGEQDDE